MSDAQLIDGGDHADLATTIAFTLAKQKKQAPARIAKDLVAGVARDSTLQGISIEQKDLILTLFSAPDM